MLVVGLKHEGMGRFVEVKVFQVELFDCDEPAHVDGEKHGLGNSCWKDTRTLPGVLPATVCSIWLAAMHV